MTSDQNPEGSRQARQGGRRRRTLIILGCLLMVLFAAIPLLRQCTGPSAPQRPWAFAACDVGQGDALFLSLGPHSAIAVDTGPDPAKEDACATRLGISAVPLVILTHFHADHVDGLEGLVHGRTVGEIETTTVDDPSAGAAQVRRVAAAAGIPVVRVRPDEQRKIGAVSWRVLWPQAEHPLQPAAGAMVGGGGAMRSSSMAEDGPSENSGPNNDSIVMAVTVDSPGGPLKLLLTGDIETPVQQILRADREQYLHADLLKVPHHGSAKQDPDFLAAVAPSVSMISVGAGNPYGHPAPRTVYLAGADGARVYRTDVDGMVLISPPDSPGGPIPVSADKGDGVIPTPPTGVRSSGGPHRHGSHSGGSHHHSKAGTEANS